jgi:hypothetical protein
VTSPYHRPATSDESLWVAKNLRPEDRAECIAASGLAPEVAVLAAFNAAPADCELIVAPGNQIIGICGVTASPLPHVGNVWMLGTPEIARYRKLFVSAGREWLAEKHQRFPVLGNIVDARNELHIRWLALMGFRFTAALLHGPHSLPFIQFERSA